MSATPSYANVTRFWHPVLAARSLRAKPVRVTVGDTEYALFRDGEGRPAALVDRCPHRFAPLSSGRVREGRIECPYHGWSFDAQGRGRSPSQPSLSRCDARAMQLVEREGYLWLADPGVSTGSLPPVTFDAPWKFAGAFSILFQCPLHVALDNFSEDEHTPWVHTRLGWNPTDADKIEYEAHNREDHTEVHYRAPQRVGLAMRFFGLSAGTVFCNDWVTRFDPVRTDYEISHQKPDGRAGDVKLRAVIFMVPEGVARTRFHVFASAQDAHPLRGRFSDALKPVTLALIFREIWDDARFIPTVAHTPWSFKGMRLGKYDKPLVHNRRLLERIYLGINSTDADTTDAKPEP
jgi:phenylpropionate dioxygenase-like ring-hydroxylating dioxygenase large terminal subunit